MAAARDRERRWKEHDFYQVLGVPRDASAADVKKGFRRVALTCHPDKVPEEERAPATRRFQLIAEAYEVLSQDATRQLYNRAQPNAGRSIRPQARAQQRPAPVAEPPQRREPQRQEPNAAWGWGQSWAHREPRKEPKERKEPKPKKPPPRRPSGGLGAGSQGPRCEGCDEHCRVADLRKCPQCPNLICPRCDLCAACIPEDQSDSSDFEGPPPPKPGAWRAQREAPQPRQEAPRRPPSPPRAEPPRPEATAASPSEPASAAGARQPQPYARGPGSRPEPVSGAAAARRPPPAASPQRTEPSGSAGERQAPASARSSAAERQAQAPGRPPAAERQAPASARGPAGEQPAAGGSGPRPSQAPAARPGRPKGDDVQAGRPEMPRGFGRRGSELEESGWQAEEFNGAEIWRRRNSKPESGFKMDRPMDRRGRHLESADSSQTEEEDEEEGAHPRPSSADPESDKPLDMAAILLAMGFKEEEVKAAQERMSSVEAAVEFLMQRSARVPSDDLGDALAGAAAGVTGLAARVGQKISAFMPWVTAKADDQPLRLEAPWKKSPQDQLVSDLKALGYSEGTAREAAKRCSSVEAAVDWLTAHHPAG